MLACASGNDSKKPETEYHKTNGVQLFYYYRIWIRGVFWLGPLGPLGPSAPKVLGPAPKVLGPAPKVLGSDSKKHLSKPDFAPF